jgi:hypothetical protein
MSGYVPTFTDLWWLALGESTEPPQRVVHEHIVRAG